jgi:GMP reductase
VAKAFGAGADFVMLGGMLAGHDQGGGTVEDGKITFYGMSSDTANEKHFGGLKEYRSSEGRTVSIPYKGDVNATVMDLLGGIRSTCTYVGAPTLKQLPKCTTFVRVNRQVNDVFVK